MNMKRFLIIIIAFLTLPIYAQKIKNVKGEATYYVNNNETVAVSKNAIESDRICGVININETHNVSIPFVVPSNLLFGEDLGNITITIYAIQQANITMQNAFDVIKGEIG